MYVHNHYILQTGTKLKFILLFIALMQSRNFEVTQRGFTNTVIYTVSNKL